MIYYANWGEKRVLLKVPLELVDYDQLQLFEMDSDSWSEVMLTMTRARKYAFVDFHENKEEGYEEWFEETSLTGLTPIRSAILQGDYRALGLFWLYAMSTADITNLDQPAPPIPPNFHQKDAALAAMIDFWQIDPILLEVAAQHSPTETAPTLDLPQAIAALSEQEKTDYLIRLAHGEPHLQARLLQLLQSKAAPAPEQPSLKEVVDGLHTTKAAKAAAAREAAAQLKRKKMEEMIAKREKLWQLVRNYVSQGKRAAYDTALAMLEELLELAHYEDDLADFKARAEAIQDEFWRKTSFVSDLTRILSTLILCQTIIKTCLKSVITLRSNPIPT